MHFGIACLIKLNGKFEHRVEIAANSKLKKSIQVITATDNRLLSGSCPPSQGGGCFRELTIEQGGAIGGGQAPLVIGNRIILNSGYAFAGKMPGNALIVLNIDESQP